MRHHQQVGVSIQNKLKVFLAEGDHSSVVHNDIVQKGVCLLVRVIDCFLVELKFADSETTQNHKWRRNCDDDSELPGKNEANKAREEETEPCFDGNADAFCSKAVYGADVFRNDVC
jgi:hypothetical protein